MLYQEFDALIILAHDLFDRYQRLAHASVGHLKEDLLGLIDDLVDLTLIAIGQRGDLSGCADQAAHHGAALHNVGIVLYVDRGRHVVNQRDEVAGAADHFQLIQSREIIYKGDIICRKAAFVQPQDSSIDHLVRFAVKVFGLKKGRYLDHRIGINQQAAED